MNKEESNVISTLKFMLKYFLLVGAAVYVGITTAYTISRTRDMNRQIIQEVISTITDDSSAMHQGYYFANTPGCYFTGLDADGNMIDGTDSKSCPILAVSEEITIGDNRYIFSACNIDLDAYMIITLSAACIVMMVFVNHVCNVIDLNTLISVKYKAAKVMFEDKDDHIGLDEVISQKNIKRVFNYKACITVPLLTMVLCCICSVLTINNYGMRITDRMSSVIQHYGIIESNESVSAIKNIDGVDVDIESLSYWYKNMNMDGNDMTSARSSDVMKRGGGYTCDLQYANNYKVLNDGNMLHITFDISKYSRVIGSHVIMFMVFMLYLGIKIHENNQIRIV